MKKNELFAKTVHGIIKDVIFKHLKVDYDEILCGIIDSDSIHITSIEYIMILIEIFNSLKLEIPNELLSVEWDKGLINIEKNIMENFKKMP